MGMAMSFMGLGGGMPSAQMLNFVMGTVYKQFIEKDISNFEDFHIAILDIFNTFNAALPGKHYDAPPHEEIEAVFKQWQKTPEADRKNLLIEFLKKNVKLSKVDGTTMIAGILTPPVAMATKRAGENVPQLKMIKAIPDVVFVPSATVLVLISVKISRRVFMGKIAS
ncbi:hypothetical protein PRUPE_2G128200 [Prunus persica]|uniref:Calcium ion binding protein n=1 Tax=Prunus persica TaxID=3760 RepID=M5VVU7_PRUPE|nr:uncharacterized protein LOC18770319 [Prunus persica]ONI22430.1 hypothetical protein PRUPE_2G128200 [Prunus persica]